MTTKGDTSAGGIFGQVAVRDAVNLANVLTGADITFAASLSGQAIGLDPALGELLLTSSMTITGPGASNLVISGENQSRIFEIDGSSGTTVTMTGLTLTAANSSNENNDYGGAILIDTGNTLAIQDSILTGNFSGGEGGAPLQLRKRGHKEVHHQR